ncbi:MAG: hypothetical protein Q7S40_10045 [Opitutaceae bacterium]|nr:hypothetical protein [Opitutaceae bacterium]
MSSGNIASIADTVRQLLGAVQRRFYAAQSPRDHAEGRASFHRDRRMLLYALTWPAVWLERRGLTCSAMRYHALLADRLAEIALHGDPACYGAYFPTYLLKCLQEWFQNHGDELYDELKHIRNALDQVLASARFAVAEQRDARYVELLASAHRLIRAQREKRQKSDGRQLSLF